MALITQLSREDVMFVAGETSSIYQHVAILSVLDASDRPDFGYTNFRQHCMERAALIPHFRWKLHTVPPGLDRPYWIEDEDFSFDHHIKHIALPAPGDREALCEVASHLYARTMDCSRPLWEIWLIEGLEDGSYAYLQKFHHCLMDGEGAFRMIEILGDIEPEPAGKKVVDKSVSEARAGQVPSVQQRSSNTWPNCLARLPGMSITFYVPSCWSSLSGQGNRGRSVQQCPRRASMVSSAVTVRWPVRPCQCRN